jgi:hypothetical protein
MPPGLTPFGQMVFKAVQTYGMVVTDYAGASRLPAEAKKTHQSPWPEMSK